MSSFFDYNKYSIKQKKNEVIKEEIDKTTNCMFSIMCYKELLERRREWVEEEMEKAGIRCLPGLIQYSNERRKQWIKDEIDRASNSIDYDITTLLSECRKQWIIEQVDRANGHCFITYSIEDILK